MNTHFICLSLECLFVCESSMDIQKFEKELIDRHHLNAWCMCVLPVQIHVCLGSLGAVNNLII